MSDDLFKKAFEKADTLRAKATNLSEEASKLYKESNLTLVRGLAELHIELTGMEEGSEAAQKIINSKNPGYNFNRMLWDSRIDNSLIPEILKNYRRYTDSPAFNNLILSGVRDSEEVDLDRLKILLEDPNGMITKDHDLTSVSLEYAIDGSFLQPTISENKLKAFEIVVNSLSEKFKSAEPSSSLTYKTVPYQLRNVVNAIISQSRAAGDSFPDNLSEVIKIITPHLSGKSSAFICQEGLKSLENYGVDKKTINEAIKQLEKPSSEQVSAENTEQGISGTGKANSI